jgi:hypothetical protein
VALALAGDGEMVAMPAAATPTLDYLLTLGPYGALVWGAFMLGKGVKLRICVELSERDRELLEKVGGRGGA